MKLAIEAVNRSCIDIELMATFVNFCFEKIENGVNCKSGYFLIANSIMDFLFNGAIIGYLPNALAIPKPDSLMGANDIFMPNILNDFQGNRAMVIDVDDFLLSLQPISPKICHGDMCFLRDFLK